MQNHHRNNQKNYLIIKKIKKNIKMYKMLNLIINHLFKFFYKFFQNGFYFLIYFNIFFNIVNYFIYLLFSCIIQWLSVFLHHLLYCSGLIFGGLVFLDFYESIKELPLNFNLYFYLIHIICLYVICYKNCKNFYGVVYKLLQFFIIFFFMSLILDVSKSNIIHLGGDLINETTCNPWIPLALFICLALFLFLYNLFKGFTGFTGFFNKPKSEFDLLDINKRQAKKIIDLKQANLDLRNELCKKIDSLLEYIEIQKAIIRSLLPKEVRQTLLNLKIRLQINNLNFQDTHKELIKIDSELNKLKNQVLNNFEIATILPGGVIDKFEVPKGLTSTEAIAFGKYLLANLKANQCNENWCNFLLRFLHFNFQILCGFELQELLSLLSQSNFNFEVFIKVLSQHKDVTYIDETPRPATLVHPNPQPQPQLPYRVYLSELPTVYPGPQAHLEALAREHSHIVVYPGSRPLIENVDSVSDEVKKLTNAESPSK